MSNEPDTSQDRTAADASTAPRRNGSAARVWRLRMILDELRDNAGDLFVHLLRHWRLILGLLAAALAGALLFAWSGLYSVAATQGHYPFFRVFLAFALRQSVQTHTMGLQAPSLDDPAMVRLGAGHYQGGCAPCHGAPDRARNPIARRMLPEPPYLASVVGTWSNEELFWIVRHGIKYAGMPSWTAPERTDEVWSMVAFLRRMPDMETTMYRRLAFGEAASSAVGANEGVQLLLRNGPVGNGVAACARCHGIDGAGDPTGAFPRLPGQTEAYLYEALKAYAYGSRPSGVMQPVAASLNDAEMRLLAAHYARQSTPPPPTQAGMTPALLARGRTIAQEGVPERNVGSCAACHSPSVESALFPRLAGQHARYIATQLELWMTGVRGGGHQGPAAGIMARAVGIDPRQPPARESLWPLSRDDIQAVSAWYASQPPSPGEAGARTE